MATESPETLLAATTAALCDGRYSEAAAMCEQLLSSHPDHPPVLALLALARAADPARFDEAISLLEHACRLAPSVAGWQNNLAGYYRVACRLDEALAAQRRAVALEDDNLMYRVNLAVILRDRGEEEPALAELMGVLARNPDMNDAHLGLAEILLARGEFCPGWIEYLEYHARLATPAHRKKTENWPQMPAPVWNGMCLPGKRILVIGDQGFGDMIQFARYIPLVADCCAEVVMICDAALGTLFNRLPGLARCLHRWEDVPPHTMHCRLSSLPGIFGTDLSSIPGGVPYIRPDPLRQVSWKERLDRALGPDKFRVGLVWAGRPTHANDRRRSLRLDQLAPLTAIDAAAFVSLQKPVPAPDTSTLTSRGRILDLAAELTDFGETAAVIANLDLVVMIDSSVAHLAGAMGKPVWVLLPDPADWRWLKHRSDSPWYPDMRLFRQPRPGAWETPISAATDALRALATEHGRS
jgi:hypothetical protein